MNSFLHCSFDSAEVCIFCVQPEAEELDGSLQNSENVFIFGCCVGGEGLRELPGSSKGRTLGAKEELFSALLLCFRGRLP